ncbi:helix-turn-helix transcriptional regulator [Sphingomonas profundi]|uniref:helix-turn-helix transcriptional regulator n=1 Tax=Alterirhizorhabdus profundi TaxID=2681549 RepID=UPI0018D15053|nr:AlpA family phage regulatory protein [Sphingomonas profundi]
MNPHHPPAYDPLIGMTAATQISSLSRSSIHRLVKAGRFPAPVQITANRIAFRESEVLAWAAEPMAYGAEADF